MRLYIYLFLSIIFCNTNQAQTPEALTFYKKGLSFHQVQNYEKAIGLFEQAIQKDPSFLDAHRSLINCHEQLGNAKATIKAYQNAIKAIPSNKKLYYNLALTYIETKEYRLAESNLKKALEIDSGYNKALITLSEVEAYFKRQERKAIENAQASTETSEEKECYQKALGQYRNQKYEACLKTLEAYKGEITLANLYYLQAITQQQLGEKDAAIIAYKKAIGLEKAHFSSNLNLGHLFFNRQDYRTAIVYLEQAHATQPSDKKLLYDLAKAYYYNQNYQLASKKLERYLEQNGQDGTAWKLLGNAYSKQGKSKSAASAFGKAKGLGANADELDNDIAHYIAEKGNKARSLAQSGNYQAAIEVLEKAVEEHPKEASLYFNLGLNYMEIGNNEKARIQFLHTVELNSAHAKAYQALGMLSYEQEKFRTAGAYFLKCIESGQKDADVYYQAGSCWFKLKQFEKAIDAYNNAIALNDREKNFFASLGAAQLALDQQYKAIESMEKVLELDPGNLEAQYTIAVAHFKMSDYATCMKVAQKILDKHPNYAKAYLMIGNSYHRMGQYGKASEYHDKAKSLDPSLKF